VKNEQLLVVAIVGVSNEPCVGDQCGGVSCGQIMKLEPKGPYEVDCKGAKGNYVYVQLPGENRQLGLEEVQVFGYSR